MPRRSASDHTRSAWPRARRPPLRATLAAARRLLRAASRADPPDPLVALWHDWRTACTAARRAGADAARLERQLIERIGTPRVAIPGRPGAFAADPADLDRMLGPGPEAGPLRADLKARLAAMQARWHAEAAACGLAAARRREAETDRWLASLQGAAARAPAGTLIGLIAKLAIAAEWSAREPEPDGEPWALVRTVLAALISLNTARH